MRQEQILNLDKRRELIAIARGIIIDSLNLDLDHEDIPPDAILFGDGLGLDSIDALQLVTMLETKIQIKLPQDNPTVLRSVNTIVDYILESQVPFLA